MGFFCQNNIRFQLEKYGRVISWHWRVWQSLKENDMKNFVKFHPTNQKSENFTLMLYFCPKYFSFELKNTDELSFMTPNSDANFKWTLTLSFQKWHKELGELSLEHSKSEKLYIDGLFLSKAYNVSARKFHRHYVSWHWRVIQNLRKSVSWLEKWHM